LNMYATQVPTSISILLPSLNRARDAANRIKSASNLRQIGLANMLYANEHPKNASADDFGTLLKTQDIAMEVFINPRTGTVLPREVQAAAMEEKIAWVNANSDYVWGGKGLNDSVEADRPVAWENPLTVDEGINILFGDGHVEWQTMAAAEQEFARWKIQQAFKN